MKRNENDKAGKDYWNRNWHSPLPKLFDPSDTRLTNYVNNKFHHFFSKIISNEKGGSKRLLEVGCARSIWLPYFAKQYGFQISGIDYSEEGCQQEQIILESVGVDADIVCADLFSPPIEMLGCFDYVFSAGVIEHFKDTYGCIAALVKFLSPGGKIISIVPNMLGTVGALQRFVDKNVYHMHVPLTPDDLKIHHRNLGLNDIKSMYFVSMNYYVVNSMHIQRSYIHYPIIIIHRLMSRLSMVTWFFEKYFGPLPATRNFSPYIVCSAIKK